jgi:putative endonuclease
MPEEYSVYVLRNLTRGELYVGLTGNLQRRLEEHNRPRGGSKKFTHRHKGEWTLVYHERYDSKAQASERERFLKTGRGREFLKTRLTQITG